MSCYHKVALLLQIDQKEDQMAHSFLNVITNEQQEVHDYTWYKTMEVLEGLSVNSPRSPKQIAYEVGCMDIVINKILCSREGQSFVSKGVVARPIGRGRSPAWVNNRQGLPFVKDGKFLPRKEAPDSLLDDDLRIQWDEEVDRFATQLERDRITGSILMSRLELFTSNLHRKLDGVQNDRNASRQKDATISSLTTRIEHLEEGLRLIEHRKEG